MVSKQSVTPFFTIITCTRNSAKYLRTCLESVTTQTFKDFEHIIVDGQSSDSTRAILQKYNLVPITLSPLGIANAMNVGISRARGQYIYFLNSDDSLYQNHTLQLVHDYLVAHGDLEWAFGNIHETDGKKTIGYPPIRKVFQGKHPNILKYYNYIPHQATFVKKSVFAQFGGFDESLKSMMDPELWLRISPKTNWGYMPIIVANYLIRLDSQSENPDHSRDNTREYEQVQQRYLNLFERNMAQIINKILR